ncbi:tRNA(fMet)-specific endonuclease VapC [Spirochaetia bacterium]|nr:tRNA(fMet)-specific endonuclease VapC [Spirochaetia bacterium]GHU48589.1 tRNA(fMet)-specific endonuclease VapC [Spirochaetia bacterium]
MTVFALDTNIVSFYIRQQGQVVRKTIEARAAGDTVIITPIAYYEVKRGFITINAATRLARFYELCEQLGVGQFNNDILDTAAEIYSELRAKNQIVEDADIFSAAFCKNHGFTLVTNNTRHFEHIADLLYCDWL